MARDNSPVAPFYGSWERWVGRGLALVPQVFLALFFFYPLAAILIYSLAPDGALRLESFVEIVTSAYYRDTLWFTFWQALLSTVLTLLLALPGAYLFARYRFPFKTLLMSLATLPFVLPTVVVAAAFQTLIGPSGVVNDVLMQILGRDTPVIQLNRTLTLILIVHVFYNYAIALRMISGYWMQQGIQHEEAARVLGAHGWRLWFYVRFPLLRPVLLAAGMLVFIFTFTSFGVVLILGGPKYATLEVEIYRQAVGLFNLPMAAALSLVQIGMMALMMLFYTRMQRNSAPVSQEGQAVSRKPKTIREKTLLWGNLSLMMVLLFAPLLALVYRSLTLGGHGLTLRHFAALDSLSRRSVLFVPPIEAVQNSLIFAAITTVAAVMLGIITAYLLNGQGRLAKWRDVVFMLPLATSAVTLGFGFTIALDEPPLNLRASVMILPIAHTLVALPFVVRSVLPALQAIPRNVQESAQVLGASPWKVWRYIDMPLMSRGIIVGATFAFTISMGEFGASSFIARPNTPTMPVVIYRLLGYPGVDNYGQALALSTLLMLVCAICFVLIERARTAGIGEF